MLRMERMEGGIEVFIEKIGDSKITCLVEKEL